MANELIVRNGLKVKDGNVFINSLAPAGATEYLTIDNTGQIGKTASAGSSYTNEDAQDAVAAMIAAGTHAGITPTYNDASNAMSFAIVDAYVDTLADARITLQKGAANGLAPLGADSKISSTYLPSYVDDVLEYANTGSFPGTGSTGVIYVALDTNKTYRWSGSVYVQITSGAVDSVNGQTGIVSLNTSHISESSNLYFTEARVLGTDLAGYSVGSNTALADTDTILQALQKIQGQLNNKQASGSYQTLDADLTAIAALSGTSGLLRKTAADTWSLDTNTYLTGNQTITLSGDVTGSGATSITTSITAATVTGKALTGYSVGTNTALAASDTILEAFQKVQGQLNAKQATITTGTTSQYFRGDLSLATLDTTAVPENSNLYFTTARVLATALTGYSVGTNSALASSDTVLGAFQKVQGQIDALPTTTKATVSLGTGTTTILSLAKSTTKSVNIHYVVYNGTHQHSGSILVTNDGTTVKFNETTTDYIGTASAAMQADAVITGSNLEVKITGAPDATYTCKFTANYI